MNWEEDTLDYGYVLDRNNDGRWWHLHFGWSASSYFCDLLGHRINIFASVQLFGPGAVAESQPFILTLDGEGVELPEAYNELNFGWGSGNADLELATKALQFQQEIMPLLYNCPVFQKATAELAVRQQHLRVVAYSKLSQV